MNIFFEKRIFTTLCVSMFISFTPLFFAPSWIFYGNIQDFGYEYSDIAVFLMLASMTMTLLITFILERFTGTSYEKAVVFLFTLGFLLWLQGNVMVWHYGSLNGQSIDWNKYQINGFIDFGVWFLIITCAYYKNQQLYRFAKYISIGLLIVQCGALIATEISTPNIHHGPKYSLNEQNKFAFSRNKNVIIVVLDSFQSDMFQQIINEKKDYRRKLTGFTYYRNALSGYSYTDLNIPLILTGRFYDNSCTFEEYKKNVYTSGGSVLKVLRENKYHVEVYPLSELTMYYGGNIISNIVQVSNPDVTKCLSGVEDLCILSLYRCLPHQFKQVIQDNGFLPEFQGAAERSYKAKSGKFSDKDVSDSSTLRFADRLMVESKLSNNNVFKFYHLPVPHWPLVLDENLQLGEEKTINRKNYNQQCRAALNISLILIDKLKELGIYDNTMLIIVADHGAGFQDQQFVLQQGMPTIKNGTIISSRMRSSALPLVLVKPFNSTGELKISDTPVSLADIPKTIFSVLNMPVPNSENESMYVIDPGSQRERRFMYYSSVEPPYYGPMTEYVVKGLPWIRESWSRSGKAYIGNIASNSYELGKKLDFSIKNNVVGYEDAGWSQAETDYTWTNGKQAGLFIPLPKESSDLMLEMNVQPYLGGDIIAQSINVYVNDKKVGEWKLNQNVFSKQSLLIPEELLNKPITELVFKMPDAASPNMQRTGQDRRVLGMAVKSMVLRKAKKSDYRQNINFGQTGTASNYMISGWSVTEKESTWTDGNSALLKIPIHAIQGDLLLRIKFCPMIIEGRNRQRIAVTINGHTLANWQCDKNIGREESIVIPAKLISESFLEVRFDLPDAVTPRDLGIGDDNRKLGIALYNILIEPKSK